MKRFLQSMFLLVAMIMTTVNANAWEFTNVSPAPNSTVTELGKIYVTIPGTMLDEWPAPTVIMTTPSGEITMSFNDMAGYFTPASDSEYPLTEEGTYTLTIPGNIYHINGAANTGQVFTWTIGSAGDGGQGGGTSNVDGKDMNHAVELTNNTAIGYTPIALSGTYYYWFYYRAQEDGTITLNDYNVNKMYCNETGKTLDSKSMDVEAGIIYHLNVSCVTASPSQASISFVKATPKPADLTINDYNYDALGLIEDYYGKTVNFKSNRTLSASHWNTLCLPFNVKTNEFEKVLNITNIEKTPENNFIVTFAEYTFDEIWAGNPVLVKAKTYSQPIDHDNVQITINEDAAHIQYNPGMAFCGTFKPMTLNGQYYISGDRFYYADTDITMNGFRAYIEVPSDVANVRSFAINIEDGATTAIEEMKATGAKTATVTFDLSGKVVKTKKGIVIENGKKIMY